MKSTDFLISKTTIVLKIGWDTGTKLNLIVKFAKKILRIERKHALPHFNIVSIMQRVYFLEHVSPNAEPYQNRNGGGRG